MRAVWQVVSGSYMLVVVQRHAGICERVRMLSGELSRTSGVAWWGT